MLTTPGSRYLVTGGRALCGHYVNVNVNRAGGVEGGEGGR